MTGIDMRKNVEVTEDILQRMFGMKVLLRYNCPAPAEGRYGWLQAGQKLSISSGVEIEQNSGLYGGPYTALLGGPASSGLCRMGAFSYSYSPLPDGLAVGRYVSISSGLRFIDSHHPLDAVTTSAITFRPYNDLFKDYATANVRAFAESFDIAGGRPYPSIGHDVWIGSNVLLAMGLTLSTGCVVAANSVVTKDVPPYAIVAGNPARIVGFRFGFDLIARLLASEWWNYDPRFIFNRNFARPVEIVDAINGNAVEKFAPAVITL